MSRTVATVWHASLSTLAAILYFLFVLPRWWELTGYAPHAVGTVFRVILGVLVGGLAVPVAATLKQARKPEYGTPQLALTLLTGSIVAHVTAGSLIVLTALTEIWLSLDTAGIWQFGAYGAAAAIALLGVGAYYLSFVAEMPPPPPKPIKPKAEKQPKKLPWTGKKKANKKAAAEADEADESDEADDIEAEEADETAEADDVEAEEAEEGDADETAEAETVEVEKPRPSGKRQAKAAE